MKGGEGEYLNLWVTRLRQARKDRSEGVIVGAFAAKAGWRLSLK